jgi:hypothetical protein
MTIRPDRYRNAIVPHIYVDGASDGIAFYKRVFGAASLFRMARTNDKILHDEIRSAARWSRSVTPTTNCTASQERLEAALPDSTSFWTTTEPCCGAQSKRVRKKSNHPQTCSMAPTPPACAIPSAMFGCCCCGRKISIREMERRGKEFLGK